MTSPQTSLGAGLYSEEHTPEQPVFLCMTVQPEV